MSAVRSDDTTTADDREARIRELFPLVRRIARRVATILGGAEIDDLVGDGSVGLIRAVDSYDPTRGVTLERYASRIIVGAMLNGVRRMDPVSERVRRTIRQAESARYALACETGSLPTMHEMEARLPGLAVARAKAHAGSPLSLDGALPPGSHADVDPTLDPQLVFAERMERRAIIDALATLPPRQRRVIASHYWREVSLRTLGTQMAISPQRVSQLHLLALGRMRKALATSVVA